MFTFASFLIILQYYRLLEKYKIDEEAPLVRGGEERSVPASRDVNLEAAYLHVLTDLVQSAGVAIAGFIIWYKPEWEIVDPLCTLMFSIFVVW